MTAKTLRDFVQSELLAGREVGLQEGLLTSGLVDSLGVMGLLSFIESRWGVKVPAGDVKLSNFKSIEAIAGYLAARDAA